MNKYRIQKFSQDIVVPLGGIFKIGSSVTLNGLLRGITVSSPVDTGTSYGVAILGNRGETLFSKSSLTENSKTFIYVDANNVPLQIPLALAGVPAIKITEAGDTAPGGTLTFSNAGAIANGATVTIGDVVYTFVTSLSGAANEILITADIKAQGTVTSDATNPDDGGTITIGAKTYTFRSTLSTGPTVANEILIGISAALTLDNLKLAVNAGAGVGVNYSTGTTANATVTATTNTDTTQLLEAITAGTAGNSIVLTESSTHLSVDGAGTLGTTQAGAWSGDTSLAHLVSAINASAGAGSTYGTGTVANPYVTAGAVGSHATVLTATSAVAIGSDVATTETSSALSFGDVTLVSGGEAADRTYTVDLYIER